MDKLKRNCDTYLALFTLVLSFVVALSFVFIYKYDNEKLLYLGKLSDYEIGTENILIVDGYRVENNTFIVGGCTMKLGENVDYVNNKFVLIDKDDNCWGMNTIPVKRESATSYFNDGFNYDNSGLEGSCAIKYLIENQEYRIGLIIKSIDDSIKLQISEMKYERNTQHGAL